MLATNYKSYAVIYSADNHKRNDNSQFMWVLTRRPLKMETTGWTKIKEKTSQIVVQKAVELSMSATII